ncbi:MAG: hypothetical protein JWN37_811 [Candidatus Nomurabacteria bacterium]|nr:hypothetical protein [Candidatus Nomurabacteria bacterium]
MFIEKKEGSQKVEEGGVFERQKGARRSWPHVVVLNVQKGHHPLMARALTVAKVRSFDIEKGTPVGTTSYLEARNFPDNYGRRVGFYVPDLEPGVTILEREKREHEDARYIKVMKVWKPQRSEDVWVFQYRVWDLKNNCPQPRGQTNGHPIDERFHKKFKVVEPPLKR